MSSRGIVGKNMRNIPPVLFVAARVPASARTLSGD
jgi:hypothetical protein